ncbi:MAG: creatininase family protein [Desulfobacterales bacterium]|jgi:creatinine amidohydrolase/Fe(II)-dependent formamide hydrolase-like protein
MVTKPTQASSTRKSASGKTASNPLSALQVFDRLEVGPVKLEPRRLTAPYRLYGQGREDRTELVYSYEETVFDPSEPESQNLADMIAAQVALNYGLFCRSIVFHGTFDKIDRRFIQDMAENTAREIYVKKFIEPNPFLTGAVRQLKAVKMQRYLRARLEFPESTAFRPKAKWQLWPADRHRHCILSSGGKDSLLSYGLINEIGREVHPIFVNESGRHWFTALNAYRYFRDNIPNTARVWVNSDRLFAWMLKHMPFIRQDFANIRSDDYPIRLWTVAVFLFGVLPLLRKRGIGRLLIGDEYDTSVRKTILGIRHHDGLYDQSIYFDQALSRYFMRKGWNISQFSVLRPLSELLIQKILVERYPDLQHQQTSCHATHKKGERIHPCGRCEKCRRIVGMLTALGADPLQCGYSPSQIKDSLEKLPRKGVLQEAAGACHLHFMLAQKGLIDASELTAKTLEAHPEILKCRIDLKSSPVNSIPTDLRKPLYRIFLEYADGAVLRSGRSWKKIDVLKDPAMDATYPFEFDPIATDNRASQVLKPLGADSYLWGELTWRQARARIKKMDVALLPVGSVEQHGPHLPLDTDAFDADYLARRVAEACSDPKPLVLPLISYGVSYHHADFTGTVSISNDTLAKMIYEIGMSVSHNGIRKLVIINGHGGNSPALNYAAQMINRDARIFVCVDTGETSDVDIYKIVETPNDVHAGEIETSTGLAARPQLVQMNQAKKYIPKFSSGYLDFTSKRGVLWYAYTRKISTSGVMGDPTKASAEKGEKIWEIMIAHLVSFVEDLKRLTLEEIHHRNY